MAAENWCMSVGDRVYGPYSTSKMADLAAQKRLAYHSLVAPAGSRDFRPALQYAELRGFFPGKDAAHAGGDQAELTHLLLFNDPSHANVNANELLSKLPESRALTATSYLVRTDLTADALRDELARIVPNTDRAIVISLNHARVASHGVGLTEHEEICALLSAG